MNGTPPMRLLAGRGRITTRRVAVVAGGLAARAHLLRAHSFWPDASAPVLAFEPGDAGLARWIGDTFGTLPGFEESLGGRPRVGRFAVRRVIDTATWQALRSRGLLVARPGGIVLAAAERALSGPLTGARLVYFSSNASANKALVFVLAPGASTPSVVVKAMVDPERGGWLEREIALVASLRRALVAVPSIGRALPPPPLWAGEADGEYLVVEEFDPLATASGAVARSDAFGWLAALQTMTTAGRTDWSAQDEEDAVTSTWRSWSRLRPTSAAVLVARLRTLLEELRGVAVPRCAVHGDFCRLNLAGDGRGMRVYDWEWGRTEGTPFHDLWTYDLAELYGSGASRDEVRTGLAASLTRLEDVLRGAGTDPRFARATLAPTLADLVLRARRATGRPNGWETATVLMEGVEDLLLD